ncbi:MAG TPA: phosphatidate cytidylyltransferase [Bryobacteraceae bacterium]|jgi:phosphatidate cytidylyltransferase|nr:phosphatidate cytidylyltransferase [Bryobacteraceae bacterium]
MKRLATALVLIPLTVWVVLWAPDWAFKAVLAAIGLIAFHEFDQIAEENKIARPGWLGMIAGLAFMLAPAPDVVIFLVAIAGMLLSLRVRELTGSMAAAAVFILGVVYIFGAWKCAIGLHGLNPHWLMFALLLSWVGDTAALYVGRALGRHKLAPQVSPAKTWEGAVGSLIGGIAGGLVYAHYLIPDASIGMVMGLAAAGNIAGQVGDLCESAMKRGAGVKDSGTTLPGHGGWLDRIDSTLFSVPVVYGLLKLVV